MSKLFPPEIIENSTQQHFVDYHTKSKIIYIIVIVVILIAFAVLPLINIDITTQNRGYIRSEYENNRLQIVVNGEIENISISENKTVQKGDTLIKLKTDKIDEQIFSLTQKISKNDRFAIDINNLIIGNYTKLETAVYLAEYNQFLSKIKEQETQIVQLEKEYSISKQLFEEDITPKMEYLKIKNNYEIALSKVQSSKEQYLNKWQIEINRLNLENVDISNSIIQLEKEKNNYLVIASISGTISQFSGLQNGSFITAGQTIAFISPNEDLIVECYISPSDIGFIKEEQEIVFQLDAFNYNQWGLAHGKVKGISKDISVINEKAVFRVRCSIDESYLQLKNGFKGHIKKGMTLTGRFYLTERNLWQLLFDKVDNWMNPKILEQG
ncbi:MAG: HlyD family efflux transporter periplasmic adaptor subunit [archaeon]|nr:HlyD family efflux transporter periplasmic adaptor subunit [archaeon]